MKYPVAKINLAVLITLVGLAAASLSGCAGKPQVRKESDAQRHARMLEQAQTAHLVVTGSPWEAFEPAARELVEAFHLQYTDSANADLLVSIDLNGRVTKGRYERTMYTNYSAPIRTGKIDILDVGFTAEGEIAFLGQGEVLRKATLYASAGGPQSLLPGGSVEARRVSKQKVLQETLADLCKQMMEIYPDRSPLMLIKQGGTIARSACLEWQGDRKSRQIVLEQLFSENPPPELLQRVIGALRAVDGSRYEDRFPVWLSSTDSSVQVQAAKKIIELTPHILANARQYPKRPGTRYPLSKARLGMVKRNNWILDAIPQANDEARPILVKGLTTNFIGELVSADYASKDWHVWCGLEKRIEQMQKERLDDPIAEIRLAVLPASPSHLQCRMAKSDPSPLVRKKAKDLANTQPGTRQTPICNCSKDAVLCQMEAQNVKPGVSQDQLKNTAYFLGVKERHILLFGTEDERRKYLRMFSQTQRLIGSDHGMIVQETGGQPEDYFEHYFQEILHHCDAQVRKLALEELPATPDQIREIAAKDPDLVVRKMAESMLTK